MKKYSKTQLLNYLKNIELLCLDADGTMTDGGMYLDDNGVSSKRFFAHDGIGISMVKHIGIKVAMITTSTTNVMAERGKILKLDDTLMGVHQKHDAIAELCKKYNISSKNVIHMGDDINDILAFNYVGLPIAVANSSATIFPFAKYITNKNGGDGAVREICDLIMLAKTGKTYGLPYISNISQ
jgi:3-deoxy-D-manno-octulosonate 8-phosphate phosphatase (KDO 8-P phosphatase)